MFEIEHEKFQKLMPRGGRRAGAGKKKGSVHRRTLEWNELGRTLLTRGNARVQQILNSADDHRFMEYYLGLLKYFKPKPKSPIDVNVHSTEIENWLRMPREELAEQIKRFEDEHKFRKRYDEGSTDEG